MTDYLLSNSTMVARLFADVPTFGYALAMGNDTFADVGERLFRAAIADETVTPDVAAQLYSDIRAEGERVGISKRKPLKEQNAKSKATQASKLAIFPKVAILARDNDAVDAAYAWLRAPEADDGLAVGTYTKTVAAFVAMHGVLVAKPDADETTLRNAIVVALTPKPEKASEAVAKIGDAFEKIVRGDKKGPSPHEAIFAKLLARAPADYAETVLANLATVVTILERLEGEADEADAIARANDANRKAAGVTQ